MTLEEYDQLERTLVLCCEEVKRDAIAFRASRQRTRKLKAYAEAITEYDIATATLEQHPEDLNAKEKLLEAKDVLNRAREALRNSLRH